MKTEFMQLWDGLTSLRAAPVLVLGATNRQGDLDPAVLRRFTLQIRVRPPRPSPHRALTLPDPSKHHHGDVRAAIRPGKCRGRGLYAN